MCFADSKQMVLYDPAAAAASPPEERASKRARKDDEDTTADPSSSSSSTCPGANAMVPYAGTTTAAAMVVLDVAPISSAPPRLMLRPPPATAKAGVMRAEPPCLRRHFLVALGLRADLPVHFIGDKCVTSTDLDAHQNRFRIPRDGVEHRLRPLLSLQELHAANLLDDPSCPVPAPPPRKRPRQPQPQDLLLQLQQQPAEPPSSSSSEPQNGEEPEAGKKVKKPKKKGKVHGGLRVKLVSLDAGAKEVQMSRWESSRGTILKGEGYLHFIRQCGLRERDTVEIWAFVQRRFRLFGADLCGDSLLHVLLVKKQPQEEGEQEPHRHGCCLCRDPDEQQQHVPPPSSPTRLVLAPTDHSPTAPGTGGTLN